MLFSASFAAFAAFASSCSLFFTAAILYRMPHDQLFLLRADFADPALGPGAYHCTDCARIEGLLSYFPQLRTQLDVTYVDFPRPRAGIVALLGHAYQNCPVLVVVNARPEHAALLRESGDTGQRYCTGADDITAYLHAAYGVSAAHP